MPEQPIAAPLSPDELEIWASLATLLERLPTALDAQLQRDSGLTHFEHGILFALDSAPDRSLRLSVLAAYASCTLSRLSRARSIPPTDGSPSACSLPRVTTRSRNRPRRTRRWCAGSCSTP